MNGDERFVHEENNHRVDSPSGEIRGRYVDVPLFSSSVSATVSLMQIVAF